MAETFVLAHVDGSGPVRGHSAVILPAVPNRAYWLKFLNVYLPNGGSSTVTIRENGNVVWSATVNGMLYGHFGQYSFRAFTPGAEVRIECPGADIAVWAFYPVQSSG
jgi:hypothetical protein